MSERATPVPIPNTEVKPLSADDSRKAKVGRRQDNGLFYLATRFIRTSGEIRLANYAAQAAQLTTKVRRWMLVFSDKFLK